MENSRTNVKDLLGKMLVQLSGEEFCALTRFAVEGATPLASPLPVAKQAVGISLLADALGCSVSFLYSLKAKGVLNDAIISHIGKKVVFDVEKARNLAEQYQAEQRASRK